MTTPQFQKKLMTITGPSCSGKTTLVRKLIETGHFTEVTSFTSRQPRHGEVEGVDYYFKTKAECQSLILGKKVAESVEFRDCYYGIECSELDTKLESDKTPIVIVEPQGLMQLRILYDCYAVYLDSDIIDLYSRFLGRFRQSPNADVNYEAKRIAAIYKEWSNWPHKVGKPDCFIARYNDDTESDIIRMLSEQSQSYQVANITNQGN